MLLFEILAAMWFFAFGAVIGSFLNVVVWRTPRGESIIGSSRCPKCGTAIRWYNNVPVFGWLWLRGKCRDCKLPISPRYPLVEFICGAMFLAVALAELAMNETSIARTSPLRSGGFVNVILDPQWSLLRTYALHMLLLCALLAWALMQVDEQFIPAGQIAGLWLIGFVVAAIWPPLAAPVVADGTMSNDGIARAWRGLALAISGFFVGGVIAAPIALAWRWVSLRREHAPQHVWASVAAVASVGLFLGPGAAVVVALLAVAIGSLSLLAGLMLAPLRTTPLTMEIFVATLIQICWAKVLLIGTLV